MIKKTFAATTQWACNIYRLPMCKHFKSRFPGLNVHRHNEPVATDSVFLDVPAIDDGATCAQLYFGTKTFVSDISGMKNQTDAAFVATLEDNICK